VGLPPPFSYSGGKLKIKERKEKKEREEKQADMD
jgi:hypothetical protein